MTGYDIVVLKADNSEKRVSIERSIYHLGEKDCDLNFPNAGFKGYGLMIKVLGSITITPGDKQEVKLNSALQNSPFEIGLGDTVQIGELKMQVVEHGKAVRIASALPVVPAVPTPVKEPEIPAVQLPKSPPEPANDTKPNNKSNSQEPASSSNLETSETSEPVGSRLENPPLANVSVQPFVRKREAWESAASAVRGIASYESPGIETQKLSKHNINTQNQIPCENCGKPIRPIVLRCPHCKNDRTEYVDQAFKRL